MLGVFNERRNSRMRTKTKMALLAGGMSVFITACSSDDKNDTSSSSEGAIEPSALEQLNINCSVAPVAPTLNDVGSLQLDIVARYVSDNAFETSSSEIVSYDDCSDRLYVVNAEDQSVDILMFNGSDEIKKSGHIDLQAAAFHAQVAIGAANSVSAKKGLIAVAIEAENKQENGLVALYRSDDLSLINTYSAGSLPDMVLLSDDAGLLLTANEGEPSGDYTVDPEGSVTIIDLSEGYSNELSITKQVSFSDFNIGGDRADELSENVRLGGPASSSVAQNIEPEYLTLIERTNKVYVSLQENNALAVIDVETARVDFIKSLGRKSWSNDSGHQLDVSDKDDEAGLFSSYDQLAGLYMPDTIVSFEVEGKSYILTANEGDSREYVYTTTQENCDNRGHKWDADDVSSTEDYRTLMNDCISFSDEERGKKLTVAADHPLFSSLQKDHSLERLKVISDGDDIESGDWVEIFGGRSFSIWDEEANLVFDSGDELAKNIFALSPAAFNANNDNNLIGETSDSRSDDKGLEPEAIEVAYIHGRTYAFIGLERQGGIAVYDVSNPKAPLYQSYINNRDFSQPVCMTTDVEGQCEDDTYNPMAGDLGPESIEYFSRDNQHFIAVGNEISGTTSIYQISFH